jgi:chromate transporter
MLNAQRSGGDRANDESYERFKRAAIDVQWSSPKFYVTHETSIVADEKAALVATFNLCSKFGSLSLLSIGGGNAVLPEMHLRTVREYHRMTDSQFADGRIWRRAVGRWNRRGNHRGVVATVAVIIPAATLVYVVTRFWQKAEKSRLRYAVENGFAPLTVGLILATSLVMSRAADHPNPLIVVGAAGLVG